MPNHYPEACALPDTGGGAMLGEGGSLHFGEEQDLISLSAEITGYMFMPCRHLTNTSDDRIYKKGTGIKNIK